MKKKFSFICLILFLSPSLAFASETFNIKPHIPGNQIDQRDDVLNLRVKDTGKQELLFDIINDYDQEVTYSIAVSNASTTALGTIDYLNVEATPDPSLKTKLSEILTIDKTVTVPARDKITIPATLTCEDEFDGIIMGAVQVIKSAGEDSEGTGLSNNLAISVPVILSMNDKQLPADLAYKSIRPFVEVGKSGIELAVQNPQPVIMPDLNLNYKIKYKGKEFETGDKLISMAPNSQMNYIIDLNRKDFKAGEYTIETQITSDYGEWKWDDKFSIDKEEASELNKKIVKEPKDYTKIIIVISFTILLAIVSFLLLKIKKMKKNI